MDQWTNLTTASAADLVEAAELEDPARDFLSEGMRPEAFVDRLRDEEQWTDALTFMAHALPTHEAVGWAVQCDRSTAAGDEGERHEVLLAAVERWLREPDEERRQAALQLAQDEPDDSSGQLLGMAAGYSDGTIVVGGDQRVEIETDMIPAMISGAVMIAAGRPEASEVEETRERFLRWAVEIAEGSRDALPEES